MTDITIDLRKQQGINPNDLPYIEWERVVNPGQSDQKTVIEKTVLFDRKGSPFVWVDESWVSLNLKKGWKIVSYGNFEKVRRFDGTVHQALENIYPLVSGRSEAYQALEAERAENAKLRAEREQLIAERDARSAAVVAGDLRTTDEKEAGLTSVVVDGEAKSESPAAKAKK